MLIKMRAFQVSTLNNYPAKSRGISPDTKSTRPLAELAKIRRYSARLSRIDNCFIIQHNDDKAQLHTKLRVSQPLSTHDEY